MLTVTPRNDMNRRIAKKIEKLYDAAGHDDRAYDRYYDNYTRDQRLRARVVDLRRLIQASARRTLDVSEATPIGVALQPIKKGRYGRGALSGSGVVDAC